MTKPQVSRALVIKSLTRLWLDGCEGVKRATGFSGPLVDAICNRHNELWDAIVALQDGAELTPMDEHKEQSREIRQAYKIIVNLPRDVFRRERQPGINYGRVHRAVMRIVKEEKAERRKHKEPSE